MDSNNLFAREISATQLLTQILVTPIGKTNSLFDLQIILTFAGNDGIKANRLIHNVERTVVDRNLGTDTPHVLICRQHIFSFALYCQVYLERFALYTQ